jgi:hypothetical protein
VEVSRQGLESISPEKKNNRKKEKAMTRVTNGKEIELDESELVRVEGGYSFGASNAADVAGGGVPDPYGPSGSLWSILGPAICEVIAAKPQ